MKLTQKQIVINHLREHGSITSLDAFTEYGITRLAAVIFKIKDEDYRFHDVDKTVHEIESVPIQVKTRLGRNANCTKYKLKEMIPPPRQGYKYGLTF